MQMICDTVGKSGRRIGERQIMEVTQLHLGHSRAEAHEHAVHMLEMVVAAVAGG